MLNTAICLKGNFNMYIILAKKLPKGRWFPYSTKLFDSKKDAVSGVQVAISIYPDTIFHIAYVGDKIDFENSAVGQTIK